MSFESQRPVMLTLENVRYAMRTLSKAPDLHSWRKSVRLVDLGWTISAMSDNLLHVSWAL